MTMAGHGLDSVLLAKLPGQIIADKYLITRMLGKGGMGAVFEAQHTLLERRFAIKLLRPELAESANAVARFRREATVAGRIEHDNVVAVIDFGILPAGSPYLVMEYLEGETLAALLKREGALTVPRAARLMVQACEGLNMAHAQGVVHRDLKPANLFVCQRSGGSEQIKIVDFGIAKLNLPGAADTAITKTGATLGTPYYMSPEQARGEGSIDHRTDIYSLGVVLYECLCGTFPHPGASYNEILFHVLTQPPIPLVARQPTIPDGLARVVERAMAPKFAERYGQISELRDELLVYAPQAQCVLGTARRGRAPSDPSLPTLAHPPTASSDAATSLDGSLPRALILDREPEINRRWSSRPVVRHFWWGLSVGLISILPILFGSSVLRLLRSNPFTPASSLSHGTVASVQMAPEQRPIVTAAPLAARGLRVSGDVEPSIPQGVEHRRELNQTMTSTGENDAPQVPTSSPTPARSKAGGGLSPSVPSRIRGASQVRHYDSKNPYR